MDFLTDNGEPLLELEMVPLHLRKYAVPNAQCRYRKFHEGELLSQLILGNDFSIWFHLFNVDAPVQLHPLTHEPVLVLHYMMKGALRSFIEGVGNVAFEERTYVLLYLPAHARHRVSLECGRYELVHINFHPRHLLTIAQQYPVFEPMLTAAQSGLMHSTHHPASVITPTIAGIIDEIQSCDLGMAERHLLLESRVRDLLRLYVRDQVVQLEIDHIGDFHLRLLKRVELFIDAHLDQELSVAVLAHYVQVSKSLLQRICRKHHGCGVYSLVIDKRMRAAARLLLHSDKSVSEIVTTVSDATFASFSAAFHDYFGQSPLCYRRNRGQLQKK